jgi:hypothetical protein
MDDVGTAILVAVLILAGIGIVIDSLFRLRNWLQRPPPGGEDREPPAGEV